MNARVNEIIDQVAALYARNFTAAELNEVVAFYRGPTGQKFIQKLPLITQESMVIGQRFGQSIAAELRSRIVDAGGAEGVRGVVVDAETTPFVDVTAARMLVAAHEELRRRGVRLVLARAVEQVRDVLGCVSDNCDLTEPYPTIKAAIAALDGAKAT